MWVCLYGLGSVCKSFSVGMLFALLPYIAPSLPDSPLS
jgi:hypothetical protein